MALLIGPNRTSSNSTLPPGYGPTSYPTPWVPPTHVPESGDAPAIHVSTVHLVNLPPPPETLPVIIPLPPTAISTLNLTMLVPSPMSIPISAPVYAAPPPMVFSMPIAHAPAHTTEPFPFPTLQPHISPPY
ncbi:hypothetical protein CRG98_033404 [Punica granatum]|nr:hypothetical protein CRG98_033404 [Punica granatum]